jgi:sugar lactone lactonase YvrE
MSVASGTIVVACPGGLEGTSGGLFTVDPHTGERRSLAEGGKLVRPWDVEVLPDGTLLVADTKAFGTGGLIAVDPRTLRQDRVWSSDDSRSPLGVARERDGHVVVCCGVDEQAVQHGRVIRVNPATGAFHEIAPGFDFGSAEGIAVDETGRIFVVDPFDLTGNQNRVIMINGGHASVRLDMHGFRFRGVTVEQSGHLAIPDDQSGGGFLFRVDPLSGPAINILTEPLFGPTGAIATEADSTIVVAAHPGLIRVNPVTGEQTVLTSIRGVTGLAVCP